MWSLVERHPGMSDREPTDSLRGGAEDPEEGFSITGRASDPVSDDEMVVGSSTQERWEENLPGRSPDEETPGAAGHPEVGSGHDDSQTTTIDEGPPVKRVDGVPGASGQIEPPRVP
ncbi:MAG: hypothetical protein QOJ59_2061 [Thermomicrobiales bacterium]|nr:hypothetical protein [Thermomicrobiales bacterium]